MIIMWMFVWKPIQTSGSDVAEVVRREEQFEDTLHVSREST